MIFWIENEENKCSMEEHKSGILFRDLEHVKASYELANFHVVFLILIHKVLD